jgi:tetratricopeptide (TPR) repeat protein
MPVRGIGGIARANLTGVLNLERKDGKIYAGFNANSALPRVSIRFLDGARVMEESRADLNPGRTWSYELPAPTGKVTFMLSDNTGRVLMRHTENQYDWSPETDIRPGPQERITPGDPLEAGTDQELNGKLLVAYETYANALNRSPENQSLRVAAGRLAVTIQRYRDAVRWLAPAQAHATYDPEIAYYLGLAYRGLGQSRLARMQFETAGRMPEFRAAASVLLAELTAGEGDLTNAAAYLRDVLRSDPADQRASDDLFLLAQPAVPVSDGDAERVLVSAADYMRLGLWRKAIDVLSREYPELGEERKEPGVPSPNNHPLLAYYRAYCRQKLGESPVAEYAAASKLSSRYVFPSGAQTLAVLEAAIAARPDDAIAHYLLGNMRLQSGLVDDAIAEWQAAQHLDPGIPVLSASLGRTLLRLKHDPERALQAFRSGLRPDPLNPDLYDGFATSAAMLGHPAAERSSVLERYPDLAHMPIALVYDLALSYAEAGMFDKSKRLFENRFFPREEGGTNVRQIWVRVRALEAESKANQGQCAEALTIVDHAREPVAGLEFTRDGLDPFLDAPPNQLLFGSVEAHCGRTGAGAKRLAMLAGSNDVASLVFARKLARLLPLSNQTDWQRRLDSAAQRQTANSSWTAAVLGLVQLEQGHRDPAAELFDAALLMPDRNLAHHISRVALSEIKR